MTDSKIGNVAELASRSILAVCRRIGVPTHVEPSSTIYGNSHLHAQDRVLDICEREGATFYINAPGGRELYSFDTFASHGIDLRFIRSRLPSYPQFKHEFVSSLSIIDVLMFNSPQQVSLLLKQCELLNKEAC